MGIKWGAMRHTFHISQGVPSNKVAKSAKVFFMIDFYSSKDA